MIANPNEGLPDGYFTEWVNPRDWADTPVKATQNEVTGGLKGDDSGYRDVAVVRENVMKFVEPTEVLSRPQYQGLDDFGETDLTMKLPGSIRRKGDEASGEKVIGFEPTVRAVEAANRAMKKYYPGEVELAAVEGYRPLQRQAAGWTQTFDKYRAQDGVVTPSPADVLKYGSAANKFFSYVKPDVEDAKFAEAMAEVRSNTEAMDVINEMAKGDVNKAKELMLEYIAYQANRGEMPNVPLTTEKNVHATGAIDVLVVDPKGAPRGFTPFDYNARWSQTTLLENEENFEPFKEQIKTDPKLRAYYEKMGFNPDNVTDEDLRGLRRLHRIRVHAMEGVGAVRYSLEAENEGEGWHYDTGREVMDPEVQGRVLWEEPQSTQLGRAGSTGWTVQTFGLKGTGAWSGKTAEEVLKASPDWVLID